jgi:hypothetical protein
VRSTVRYLTERVKGHILLPNDKDKKTGDSFIKVLESKRQNAKTPDNTQLKEYLTTPYFVDVNITTEKVIEMAAQRLSTFLLKQLPLDD